jgi:hypothetical protein
MEAEELRGSGKLTIISIRTSTKDEGDEEDDGEEDGKCTCHVK